MVSFIIRTIQTSLALGLIAQAAVASASELNKTHADTKNNTVIFLEARSTQLKPAIHTQANINSTVVSEISAGQIYRLNLSLDEYARHQKSEIQNQENWQKFNYLTGKNSTDVYFQGHWQIFKTLKLSNHQLTLKYIGHENEKLVLFSEPLPIDDAVCTSKEAFCIEQTPKDWLVDLVDTKLIETSTGIKLFYQIEFSYFDDNDDEQSKKGWVEARHFIREVDYYQVMQNSCVATYELQERSTPLKQILAELQVIPRRQVIIRRVSDKAFTLSGRVPSGFRNRFIKTKVIQSADTNADITVLREEVEISPIWGWSLGHGALDLDHSTPVSHISYRANQVKASASVFIPAWATVDIGLRAEFEYPYEQESIDEVKKRESKLDPIYQAYVGQLFILHEDVSLSFIKRINYGFGLSYRSIFGSSGTTFGLSSIVGGSLMANLEARRWVLGTLIEPIGNNFKFGFENRSLQFNFAFKLTTNEYEANWMLFTKYIDLRYEGEQRSVLASKDYVAGLAYGY